MLLCVMHIVSTNIVELIETKSYATHKANILLRHTHSRLQREGSEAGVQAISYLVIGGVIGMVAVNTGGKVAINRYQPVSAKTVIIADPPFE
ncbi:hypothetical protein D3C80_1777360 [compost metagenome]